MSIYTLLSTVHVIKHPSFISVSGMLKDDQICYPLDWWMLILYYDVIHEQEEWFS